MRYLKLAKKYDPNNKTININIGNLCVKEKRYEEAIGFYEESLKTDTQNLTTLRSFMNCLANVKDYTRLEQVCKTVLILDKTNTKALALLIRSLKKNNKFDQLEKIVAKVQKKLIKIGDNYSVEFVSQPSFKKLNNKINEKLLEIRNNIRIQDQEEIESNDNIENQLRDFRKKNIKYDESDEFAGEKDPTIFIKILQREPNNYEAYLNLGMIYFYKQQYELSEEYLYKLHELYSEYRKFLVNDKIGKPSLIIYFSLNYIILIFFDFILLNKNYKLIFYYLQLIFTKNFTMITKRLYLFIISA